VRLAPAAVPYAARRVFSSLSGRNYRLWFCGQLVSLSGTWMQQVAQDWLVLQLTGRALPVGITTALQFAPVALFGIWGGLVADRLDKRRLLIATQAAAALLALTLGLLSATGVVQLWMVYLLAFALGTVTAFDLPARQAFVTEMVGPGQVANAVALNSALFNSARVIGPALAGAAILAFGLAPAFLVNAASYLATMSALVAMDPGRLHRQAPARRAPGQVRDGLRYIWRTPVLRSTLLLVTVVGTLGLNFNVVLPVLARFEFHAGPGTYGLMISVMAAGSIVGALIAAGRQRPTRALLVGAAGAFGLCSLAAAAAPTLAWELAVLVGVGAATITFLSTANTTLQLNSDPAMRGRVMALYGVLFLGSTPLGGALSGWLAEVAGARSPLWLGGTACLAAALAGLAGRRARPTDREPVRVGRRSPGDKPDDSVTAPSRM
jgi:MFS family permease